MLMIQHNFWDDDSSSVSSVDSFVSTNNAHPPPSIQQIMKLAGKHWKMLPTDLQDAWKVRADRLNRRPATDGVFETIPRSVSMELQGNIKSSLTMEWAVIAKSLKALIRRNIHSAHSKQSEQKFKFGGESIVIASQSQKYLNFSHLLLLTIFGFPLFAHLSWNEMAHRTKRQVVIHLYGRNRIASLLEFGGLAGWRIVDWESGMEHCICGKVIVGRDNRSTTGFVMEEADGLLKVLVSDGRSLIVFRRPVYDRIEGLFRLPIESTCNTYSLLQVDPIRIKINTMSGHSSIIISATSISTQCNNDI